MYCRKHGSALWLCGPHGLGEVSAVRNVVVAVHFKTMFAGSILINTCTRLQCNNKDESVALLAEARGCSHYH
jgi:hypothetical protein